MVSAGGILAETALAVFATWGWLILPEGPARGACFVVAATGWVATLIVNLNPFLRFDGYYMLSDVLGIRNLQTRSFGMGKWALRRLLFGWSPPSPELGTRRFRAFLTGFAWLTWSVRAAVFFGLAILAYVLFGKPFGIIMAVFEIWLLVATPVLMEIREWVRERRQWLGQRRAHVTLALFGLLLAWLLIPQSYRLSLPAVLAPAERQWVHSPRAAIIVEAPSDDMAVAKGQNILVIRDPELDHAIAQSKRRLEMIKLVLRQTASTQMAARQQAVIDQELAQEQTALDGLLNQKRMLTVAVPFGGRITEIDPLLRPGHWTDPDQPLFMVVGGGQDRLLAYVDDRDRSLIEVGGKARFYPESPDFPVMEGVVAHVQVVPAEYLAEPLLASIHGGEIPAREDQQKRLVPEHSLYQVSIIVPGLKEGGSGQVLRGTVQGYSKPYSLAGLILDRFRALFAREMGF
jgi:putative peptide zinc metalloprotease protein